MKQYQIIVLGTSGAGKTVFLASMFHKLSVQRRGIGFYLRLPSPQSKTLVNVYSKLADVNNKSWPKGTRDVSQWDFTCHVKADSRSYPVFKFSYFDYAGGILTDPTASHGDRFSIDTKAQEADAILVLIDGQKLLYAMQQQEYSFMHSLQYDLNHLLPIINHVPDKPIHFVVTKWDLLEQHAPALVLGNESLLGAVRRHLFSDDAFAAIVDQRMHQQTPTRLIPVSAIGRQFAQLQTSNQHHVMQKMANGRLQPTNVELPLAYVIPDGFDIARRSVQNSARYRLLSVIFSIVRLLGWAGELISLFAGFLPINYRLGANVIGWLMSKTGSKVSLQRLSQRHAQLQSNMINEQMAVESAILSYKVLIRKFEDQYPASDLMRHHTQAAPLFVMKEAYHANA